LFEELVIHIVILIVMLFLFIITFTFPSAGFGGSLGPGGWPRIVLGIGIFLTSISILSFLRKKEKKEDISKERLKKFFTAALIMLVYILIVQPIGFLITTPFAIGAYLYLMGIRKKTSLLFLSILLSFIFIFLFGRILQVNLPRGFGFIRVLSFYFY